MTVIGTRGREKDLGRHQSSRLIDSIKDDTFDRTGFGLGVY